MKEPQKGDVVFTHDDCGIVERVGINKIELNNNVNTYDVPFDDIEDVI